MQKKHMITLGIGIFALIAMTATASALITRERLSDKPLTDEIISTENKESVPARRVAAIEPAAAPAPVVQAAPACDDGNIAGTVLGGAAGGLVGSQIGNGSGQTAATIAGVVGGALAGREYIPTHNVTCAQ